MLVRQVDELLGDLLLEVKLGIEPLQRTEGALKSFQAFACRLLERAGQLGVLLR